MPAITLNAICNHICKDTHLSIRDGEMLVLAGSTGAGKTTLLNVISGLTSYRGRVQFDGEAVDDLSPSKRNVGYLFQDFALFPHLTVKENIAFGLHARGLDREAISKRVNQQLDMLKIRHLEDRYPKALSGGEKQRTALARTLAPAPDILLLDEPFSSLDPRTAKFLRLELKHLQKKMALTSVYVTHNQMEAFEMGDRIAVVHQGCISQIGKPAEILFAPKTNAVSKLFGSPNILECQEIENLDFGLAKAVCGRLTLIVPYEGRPVEKIAVFPAGIHLAKDPIETPMPNRLNGSVHAIRHTPPVTQIDIDCKGQIITAELPDHLWLELDIHRSDRVYMAIPLKRIRLLGKTVTR